MQSCELVSGTYATYGGQSAKIVNFARYLERSDFNSFNLAFQSCQAPIKKKKNLS